MLTEKGQTGEDLLYPNPKDLEKRAGLYSAGIDPNTSLSLLYNSYSWIRWFLFMVCGLVAPPIFFLLSMGSFDSRSHPSSCYTGYYYTGEQAIVTRRKFSRTQKTTSFVIGILCCMIVLAMIGVGFGIGIRNEHNF